MHFSFIKFADLKKFLSILFLTLYLGFAAEGYQLLKIPNLIEHLKEHRTADPTLSFFGFLVIHYFGDNVPDDDHHKDMNLPFKSHQECLNGSINVITPPGQVKFSSTSAEMFLIGFNSRNCQFISSLCSSSIWQPPKFS